MRTQKTRPRTRERPWRYLRPGDAVLATVNGHDHLGAIAATGVKGGVRYLVVSTDTGREVVVKPAQSDHHVRRVARYTREGD